MSFFSKMKKRATCKKPDEQYTSKDNSQPQTPKPTAPEYKVKPMASKDEDKDYLTTKSTMQSSQIIKTVGSSDPLSKM